MSMQTSLSAQRPLIALLTDFGLDDGYVAVMKAVMLNIAAQAQFIDISHTITPQNIASGAWVLATSYRYFAAGTIFLCVVDPGVGSTRRPVAIRAGNWFFVGPDNGLFSFVLAEQPVHEAVVLENSAYHLERVSTTFHGRDIFSPVAAHLARGSELNVLGSRIDPAALIRLGVGLAQRQDNQIAGRILHVDHFGNLVTNIPLHMVPEFFSAPGVQLTFPAQGVTIGRRRRYFAAETGESEEDDVLPFLYNDSSDYIGIAIRNGNAARVLEIGYGTALTLLIGTE